MIRKLTGVVAEVSVGWVVIDVAGVGYLVRCPTTVSRLVVGGTVVLHTYLAVRENALDLYGFEETAELAMFELLLGIPKIGPKSALQILCQATPTLLAEAAHKNDATYLQKLSGIGKKTCENIVQYLGGKLDQLPAFSNTIEADLSAIQTDAIDVLISLGYDPTAARETILALPGEEATVNTLVKQALKHIP